MGFQMARQFIERRLHHFGVALVAGGRAKL